MGRYFFTIKNNVDFRDNTGHSFAGPEEAIRYAEVMAQELARRKDLHAASVEVSDDQGNLVTEVAIPARPA